MNLSQRDGGLPPDSVVQDEDTILADSARLIDHYHQPDAHAMAQVALAPCSPFSVSTSLMRRTAELAEAHGVRLHTHLAETHDRFILAFASPALLPVLRALSLCTCCRHYPGAADGVLLAQTCPIRISLPRFHCRVGLHIDLFEVCSAFTRVAACTLAWSPNS